MPGATLLALIFLLTAQRRIVAARTPASSYFNICKRSDTNLNDCVKKSIQNARSRLVKGIPELDVVPLDPLYIPLLNMSESIGITFLMKDTNVTGLRDFKVQDADFNLNNLILKLSVVTPSINFHARYEMEGKIITLPIRGSGEVFMNFTNVLTNSESKMERYKKNGKEYMGVVGNIWNITPQHYQSHFTNLFNGDKILGETTNRVLNENWKENWEIFKNVPQRTFALVFKELSNRLMRHYTIDEWLPQ